MPLLTTHHSPLSTLDNLPESVRDQLTSRQFRVAVENKADGSLELLVMGIVGDPSEGLASRQVAELLAKNPEKPVRVRINSPGGLAYDGITIHNALVRHKGQVTVEIEGMAGSAAAVIAMAGRPVRIWENASLYIHRAQGIAVGNRVVMEDLAGLLDRVDQGLGQTFAAKSGQPLGKIMDLLTGKVDGTMLTPAEALDLRLVDEIVPIKAEGQGAGAGKQAAEPAATAAGALREEAEARLLEAQRLWEIGLGAERPLTIPAAAV